MKISIRVNLSEHERLRYADSEFLRAAGFFAGVRRMRTRQKRRTIREGALPLLLSFLSFEISPPYLHPVPAALPTACGVRARLLHSLGALRCLRRARLLSWLRLVSCERERLRFADSEICVPLFTFG